MCNLGIAIKCLAASGGDVRSSADECGQLSAAEGPPQVARHTAGDTDCGLGIVSDVCMMDAAIDRIKAPGSLKKGI